MGHGIKGKTTPPAQLDAESAASVAATLQALATPSRLRILTRLRHGACSVNDLSAAVEMEQSAVSHQLRLLRAMGLVTGAQTDAASSTPSTTTTSQCSSTRPSTTSNTSGSASPTNPPRPPEGYWCSRCAPTNSPQHDTRRNVPSATRIYAPRMRDIEVIDFELRLLVAIRHMAREAGGRTPNTARTDELLDERSATMVLNTTVGSA